MTETLTIICTYNYLLLDLGLEHDQPHRGTSFCVEKLHHYHFCIVFIGSWFWGAFLWVWINLKLVKNGWCSLAIDNSQQWPSLIWVWFMPPKFCRYSVHFWDLNSQDTGHPQLGIFCQGQPVVVDTAGSVWTAAIASVLIVWPEDQSLHFVRWSTWDCKWCGALMNRHGWLWAKTKKLGGTSCMGSSMKVAQMLVLK